MSYGANAAAGLKSTKGNPLLIAETYKPGIFPESYANKGSHGGGVSNDDLRKTLRFRHGPKLNRKGIGDGSYVVRQTMTGAFLDSHAERMNFNRVVDPDLNKPQVGTNGSLLWRRDVWLGIRRSGDFTFD